MAELPTGTVTFLFTDLEGSTRLWEEHPDEMKAALAEHDRILHDAIEAHGGVVFSEMGDGMAAAFASPSDAIAAVVEAQLGLGSFDWGVTGPLRARMGLHAGEGVLRPDGQYVNQPLNRCARLMAIAHGGQVVVSDSVEHLVRGALPADVGLVDLGEHRLRDLASPIGVFQLTHPSLGRDFPPLKSLDALPGNLPIQVSSFVGREGELKRVVSELADARVITLTGVGGVGKTRLSLEVGAELVPDFRDGVWLVELAGVRDPEAVPDVVMGIFGLQPRAGLSAIQALQEFLQAKTLLLVIDNCEHLLRAVASVVDDVVRTCPGVRVLATSREGLNVAGERILAVASLDLPSETEELAAIADCDAVLLFVERARAVKAGFALDDSNARDVVQICRRLDGIALAIELAAARVSMLTPSELARRLDQRFRLLAGGQRSAVERHQTLRAAVDWSYDLLSETEQTLLDRLSIFVGGFSLEAAETVSAGGLVEADAVFDALAALVARSLVVADTEGVDTRYRLLETIRQYAQERLDDADGDGDQLRDAHAGYYADFGERAIPETAGLDGIAWQQRVELEYDNIRSAISWAVEAGDAATAVRLLAMWDMAPFFGTDVGLISSLFGAADAVVALPGAAEQPGYAGALGIAANVPHYRGDQELAKRLCDEALAAETRLGIEPSIAIAVLHLNIALAIGDAEEAVRRADRAVGLARTRGEPAWLLVTLGWSGLSRILLGDVDGAARDASEALAFMPRLPHTRAVRMGFGNAAFALGGSDPARALELIRQILDLIPPGELNMTWPMAGDLAARQGEQREALTYFVKGMDSMQWFGQRHGVGTVVGRIGVLIADDDPEAAAVLYAAGEALAPGFAHAPHTIADQQRALATLEASLGAARLAELQAQGAGLDVREAIDYVHAAVDQFLANDRDD